MRLCTLILPLHRASREGIVECHSSLLFKWGMRDERGKSILACSKSLLATVQVLYSRYRSERERERRRRERKAETQKTLFLLFFFDFRNSKTFFAKKRGGKKKEKTKRLKNIPFSRREGDEDQEKRKSFLTKGAEFCFFRSGRPREKPSLVERHVLNQNSWRS